MSLYVPHSIRIRIPGATEVAILGDFNNWHSNAHPLLNVGQGTWERILDLPPGKHRYAFFAIVAGEGGQPQTKVIGNGAVLYVPEDPEQTVSIQAHGALAFRREIEKESRTVHTSRLRPLLREVA